jgi:hypothetical protein
VTSGKDRRLDLHNTSIDDQAASAGQCGFIHLASGRVCRLPHGHRGPCLPTYSPSREMHAVPQPPPDDPPHTDHSGWPSANSHRATGVKP